MICTYDSSPVLAAAMQAVPAVSFDLAVADEAHRCAGLETSSHKTILDENAIRAERRLFFTATPTVVGTRDKVRAARKSVRVASMDDYTVFGPVIHHLSFAEAVAQKLLCPYEVTVIPVSDEEVHELIRRRRIVTADGDHNLEAGHLATQIACARAMSERGCRRMVAFHRGIKESRRFSEHFPVAAALLAQEGRPWDGVWSRHVDGDRMPYAKRMQTIEQFERADGDEPRLLSNVRLLSEGVDVPGIDSIVFVDTRRGQAAIIQAVGRAVRCYPGKKVGTIILPIIVRGGESIRAALARSEHRHIADVLGALRSHDPDILKSLDELHFSGSDDGGTSGHGRFVIEAPLEVGEEFAEAIELALAETLGLRAQHASRRRAAPVVIEPARPRSDQELFDIGLTALDRLGRWHLLPQVPEVGGFPMREWWGEVRRRWAAGTLGVDRLVIADALSWLTADLDELPALRRELARLSEATLAEQIASQCRPGGVLTDRPFGTLIEHLEPDELIGPLTSLERTITHAGCSSGFKLQRVSYAVGLLARALEPLEPKAWRGAPIWRATLAGFVHELEFAGALDESPPRPWTAHTEPVADEAGRQAAAPLIPLARHMRIYRFPGDVDAVEDRVLEEFDLSPDERLDALGWDIYLLSRARGADSREALDLAMQGTLRRRTEVRRDLRARSVRRR